MTEVTALRGLASMTITEISQLDDERTKELLIEIRDLAKMPGLEAFKNWEIEAMSREIAQQWLFDAQSIARLRFAA